MPSTRAISRRYQYPAAAARLTLAQIRAALKRARRRDIPGKAAAICDALRTEHLGQAETVASAYASSVRATVAVLQTLNAEITTLEEQVGAHFGQHPDAEVYLSQPGIGVILGAQVLAEFGDAPGRYADAKSRKNYAGTAPITRQSVARVFGVWLRDWTDPETGRMHPELRPAGR